ncbi:MAG: [LysW]-aminoadipate/[LysW]-glutamate kinase [Candidatus Bathyarchaeota archaeon]
MVKVIKLGGSILKTGFPHNFILDLKNVLQTEKIIFVHGGAALVTSTAEMMNRQQKFVVSPDGMKSRYTDKETMDIFTMVMAGKINKHVVASLESYGIKAIGICGVDGHLLKAKRKEKLIIVDEKGKKMIIDGGYTGKISEVNVPLLQELLNLGLLPVVAPIAMDNAFELLNVDSDRAAAYIAGAIKAESLIFCTDVPGVILNETTVDKMTVEEAKMNLNRIGHGMKKKIYASIEALEMGLKESVITSGLLKTPITSALKHEGGTLIAP